MPKETKKLVLNQETLWWLTGTTGTDNFSAGTIGPTGSNFFCGSGEKTHTCAFC
jgi:hypothetical protein